MNGNREKRVSFFSPLLLPAVGGFLFLFAFFCLQTVFSLPSTGGYHPLREGKILFALHGRTNLSRLLSSSGRGERANSQNKRNRGSTPALLPAKQSLTAHLEKGEGRDSVYGTIHLLFSLYRNNPARAGPDTFFPVFFT